MPSLSSNHSSSNKKQTKTKSKLSSSSIPDNAAATPPCTTATEPQHFASLCQQASRIFPSFISQSAFVAEITDIESTDSLSNGAAKIWLSESSMVAYSLAPGSLVSVSIPSSSKGIAESHNFPLTSLTAECVKFYGLETCKALGDGTAGNYFAIATVFPAKKVLKNAARLSSILSFSIGCPPLGTCMFVHPLQKQSLADNCKELYLQLAPCKSGPTLNVNNFPSLDLSNSKSCPQSENDIVASPKTPYGSNFSNDSVYSSSVVKDLASSVTNYNGQSVVSFDVSKALGNETSKKLLETCATALLRSRSLLLGNLVTVPILSEFFIFQVMDIRMSTTIPDYYPLNGSSYLNLEDSDMVENVNVAFTADWETKVYLSLPSNSAFEESIQKDLSCLKLDNRHDKISKLGGLSKEEMVLNDLIFCSKNDIILSRFSQQNTGVLLHGPPGTGKTSLARLSAHDARVNFFSIGPEIVTQYEENEKALHEVFDSALQAAPAVIFIDKIDKIAPTRKDGGGEELYKRLVVTLLDLMDGIRRNGGLLVIAATNKLDLIDPALRQPGRFDEEIEFGVPSKAQREDILRTILCEIDHSLSETQIEELASITHGFVGADLVGLRSCATSICLQRFVELKREKTCNGSLDDIEEQPAPMNSATNLRDPSEKTLDSGEEHISKVTYEDFQKARLKIKPSAMREVWLMP